MNWYVYIDSKFTAITKNLALHFSILENMGGGSRSLFLRSAYSTLLVRHNNNNKKDY